MQDIKSDCLFASKAELQMTAKTFLDSFRDIIIDPSIKFDLETNDQRQQIYQSAIAANLEARKHRVSWILRTPWAQDIFHAVDRLRSHPWVTRLKNQGLMEVIPGDQEGNCQDGVCTSYLLSISVNPDFGNKIYKKDPTQFPEFMAMVIGHEIGHVVIDQATYDRLPDKNIRNFIDAKNAIVGIWEELMADAVSSLLNTFSFRKMSALMALADPPADSGLNDRRRCLVQLP